MTKDRIEKRFVAEQVALMLGAFPNCTPHNPRIYVGTLITEILTANPSAAAVKSACRRIQRTKTFAPTISEMLEALRIAEDALALKGGE